MDAHSGSTPLSRRGQFIDPRVSQQALKRVVGSASERTAKYGGLLDPGGAVDVEATEMMLSRLVTRMRWGGYSWPSGSADWASDDNPEIPAGYTYLAQLVAHDMVQNTAQLPLVSAFPGQLQRDYRTQRLVLDTIYGGGPAKDPLPYGITMNGSGERCLFRLGHVRGQEPQPFDNDPQPPLDQQPARDIPRLRCPHLSDQPSRKISPDVLIADARNDQHLLISQLTAFFLELHNNVFKKVRSLQDEPTPALTEQLNFPMRLDYVSDADFRRAQDDMAFLQTRKLVAFVYRRIIIEDLLRKLLEPGVYAYYTDPARRFPDDLYDKKQDSQVPIEFSHAVFRFGHVMTRFTYKLNDMLDPDPSIKDLLDRSSARRRDLLPLAANWLVDWSRFFDLGDGKVVNASRRIGPFVAHGPLVSDAAVPSEKNRDGGLFYRDFVRGYEAGVSTVDALIGKLRASERDRSELLKDANLREHEIGLWLKFKPDIGVPLDYGFTPEELVSLSRDPPLLFYIMFESAYSEGGRRLGILGSTLVADVFFTALKLNRSVIEDDAAVPVLAQLIFGADVPSNMMSAIAYVKAQGGLADVSV